jgi:regulatory protein
LTDSGNNAKKYSLKLLGYRGRSENELKHRLIDKGFADNIVSDTINFLKQHGYIDDLTLAGNLKREALKNRLLGYNGAKRFMQKRGIPLEVIESSLEYDEETDMQNALRLADKRVHATGNEFSFAAKRRLWNFLARRGYSFDTIKKVIEKYNFKKEENE